MIQYLDMTQTPGQMEGTRTLDDDDIVRCVRRAKDLILLRFHDLDLNFLWSDWRQAHAGFGLSINNSL